MSKYTLLHHAGIPSGDLLAASTVGDILSQASDPFFIRDNLTNLVYFSEELRNNPLLSGTAWGDSLEQFLDANKQSLNWTTDAIQTTVPNYRVLWSPTSDFRRTTIKGKLSSLSNPDHGKDAVITTEMDLLGEDMMLIKDGLVFRTTKLEDRMWLVPEAGRTDPRATEYFVEYSQITPPNNVGSPEALRWSVIDVNSDMVVNYSSGAFSAQRGVTVPLSSTNDFLFWLIVAGMPIPQRGITIQDASTILVDFNSLQGGLVGLYAFAKGRVSTPTLDRDDVSVEDINSDVFVAELFDHKNTFLVASPKNAVNTSVPIMSYQPVGAVTTLRLPTGKYITTSSVIPMVNSDMLHRKSFRVENERVISFTDAVSGQEFHFSNLGAEPVVL